MTPESCDEDQGIPSAANDDKMIHEGSDNSSEKLDKSSSNDSNINED